MVVIIIGLVIWPRLGDPFDLKIPDEFVRLILQDRFWVVHIPFVHMAKLQFLALFQMDPLALPIMSSLILFLLLLLLLFTH